MLSTRGLVARPTTPVRVLVCRVVMYYSSTVGGVGVNRLPMLCRRIYQAQHIPTRKPAFKLYAVSCVLYSRVA